MAASHLGDGNDEAARDVPGGFTIDKAASTVAVTCPSVHPTFTGSAIEPCSAKATGAGGLNQSLAVSYANNVHAGLASASASFGGDDDHTGGSDSAGFTIDKAASTVAVTCPSVHPTFTGSAIEPCSAKATGAGGLNQSLAVSYANNAHEHTAEV